MDPDEESLNKAIQEINAEIDRKQVQMHKLRLQGKSGGDDKLMQMLGGILGGQGGGSLGQIGGMVGAKVGGPVGAEIGKIIAEAIPKTLAAPMEGFNTAVGSLSKSLQEVQGSLGGVGAGLSILTSGLESGSKMLKGSHQIGVFGVGRR